jgi:hypothetical protein
MSVATQFEALTYTRRVMRSLRSPCREANKQFLLDKLDLGIVLSQTE